MTFVYILQSQKNNRFYVGTTDNLGRRMIQHNLGKNKSTKSSFPFELVYKEKFSSLSEARKRESYIKRQKSKQFIEKLIEGWSLA